MSQLIFTKQASAPSTPATNKIAAFVDNTTVPLIKFVDETGGVTTNLDDKLIRRNFSTADQTGFASDTYLAGSGITFPSGRPPVAGAQYYACFDMVKTAAGTAAPILTVRFGTTGTTADSGKLLFLFALGTAAIDTGVIEVWVHFRTVGATAVIVGVARITHHLAATGLTSTGASGTAIIPLVSGTFDSTVPNSIIGVSLTGGASFAGTNRMVRSTLQNLSI